MFSYRFQGASTFIQKVCITTAILQCRRRSTRAVFNARRRRSGLLHAARTASTIEDGVPRPMHRLGMQLPAKRTRGGHGGNLPPIARIGEGRCMIPRSPSGLHRPRGVTGAEHLRQSPRPAGHSTPPPVLPLV
jgi:hypothetical protein